MRLSVLAGRIAQVVTQLITWAIKLVGLGAASEQLFGGDPKFAVLAFTGFMMAGAQFSEGFVLGLIERLLLLPGEAQGRDQQAKLDRTGSGPTQGPES